MNGRGGGDKGSSTLSVRRSSLIQGEVERCGPSRPQGTYATRWNKDGEMI